MDDERLATRPDLATTASAVGGLLCIAISIGIFDAQMYQMFFDKSIDATLPLLAPFVASLGAPLLRIWPGPRRALAVTAVALAAATLIATLGRTDAIELAGSAVGIVAGTWWLALIVGDLTTGAILEIAMAITLALLLLMRAAAGTLPLDEMPPPLALTIDVALGAALVVTLPWVLRTPTPAGLGAARRSLLSGFAIPFLLIFAMDIGLNGAVVAGAAGFAFAIGSPASASTELGLLAAGLGTSIGLIGVLVLARPAIVGSIFLIIGGALLADHPGPAAFAGGALVAAALILCGAAVGGGIRRSPGSPVMLPIALGLGWIAAAIAALAYYLTVGSLLPLAITVGVVALAAVLAPRQRVDLGPLRAAIGVLAVLASLVPAASAASAMTAASVPAPVAAPAHALRLMAYNVHLGYSDADVPSTADLAAEISAQSPDLVALEEVTRGTIIAGGHDLLGQLAERLGMTYAFAPMFGDIEGVAILSRFPITDVRIIRLAQSPTPRDLRRVALVVRVGGFTLVATHLGGGDLVAEVRSLVAGMSGVAPIAIAGDMNSTPGTPQMTLFSDAGFTDLGAVADAPTAPATTPTDRIDYMWTKGLTAAAFRTIATTASDHRPVVADIEVP